jgi:hypothetical protein
MGTGQLPVMHVVRETFALAWAWRRRFIAGVAVLGLLGAGAQVAMAATAGGEGLGPVLAVIDLLITVFFTTALLKFGVTGAPPGPLGLDIGMDALRVLAAQAITTLFVIVAAIPAVMVASVLMTGVLSATGAPSPPTSGDPLAWFTGLPTPAAIGVGLIFIAFLAAIGWVAARLSVAPAATIARGRLVILETWGWTQGEGVRILATLALTTVPALLVLFAMGSLLDGGPGEAAPNLLMRAVSGFAVGAAEALLLTLVGAALTVILWRGFDPEAGR